MKYFTLREFSHSNTALRKGIDNRMPGFASINAAQLVQHILDPAREQLGSPIVITSGYRSELLNREIGGSKGSQHCLGEAADIVAYNGNNLGLLQIIKTLPYDQLIVYRGKSDGAIKWLHVSFRLSGNRGFGFSKYV